MERRLGERHPSLSVPLNNLGGILRGQGELTAARAAYERALAIDRAHHGADDPLIAYGLTGIGETALAAGDVDEAIERLERALALRERADAEVSVYARSYTRFALARARWAAGARSQALAGARDALAGYRSLGAGFSAQVEELERWLAARS